MLLAESGVSKLKRLHCYFCHMHLPLYLVHQATDAHGRTALLPFTVEVVNKDDVYFTDSAGTRLTSLPPISVQASTAAALQIPFTVYVNSGNSVACAVQSGSIPPCTPSQTVTQTGTNSLTQTATYCLGTTLYLCTASKANRVSVSLRYVCAVDTTGFLQCLFACFIYPAAAVIVWGAKSQLCKCWLA